MNTYEALTIVRDLVVYKHYALGKCMDELVILQLMSDCRFVADFLDIEISACPEDKSIQSTPNQDTTKCIVCDGKGQIEKCEYTPPFERFFEPCFACNGVEH